ncbi:hypothetical protein MD484_g8875, partial [Candolleomyces efflorescens]
MASVSLKNTVQELEASLLDAERSDTELLKEEGQKMEGVICQLGKMSKEAKREFLGLW